MQTLNTIFGMIFLSSIAFINSAHATVGGGQPIDVLGYDKKDQKIYVLRHYQDAGGRLPQLYYYALNSAQPNKLIEVKSIYLDPKTKKYDHHLREKEINQSIEQIKKRLIPLQILNPKQVKLTSNYTVKHVPSWGEPDQLIPQFHYHYQLNDQTSQLKSAKHSAISYKHNLHVSQYYKIPQQNISLAVVTYLAFPEETGYNKQDAVLLSR